MGLILVGADPEIMLQREGRLISALGIIPGDKKTPYPAGGGFALQADGVSAEFNVPAADSLSSWESAICRGVELVEHFAKKAGCSITQHTFGEYGEDQLADPRSRELGCDRDYNAWDNGNPNMVDPLAPLMPYRCAGGHIHIGCQLSSEEDLWQLVKALDLLVTLPSMHLDNKERRYLYGKAGCYRQKKYGVEYRTPGNFWIFEKKYREWIYNQVHRAVQTYRDIIVSPDIENVINSHDLDGQRHFTNQYGLVTL